VDEPWQPAHERDLGLGPAVAAEEARGSARPQMRGWAPVAEEAWSGERLDYGGGSSDARPKSSRGDAGAGLCTVGDGKGIRSGEEKGKK
jgi:hypothetical protein